jgi:hypothetical protein
VPETRTIATPRTSDPNLGQTHIFLRWEGRPGARVFPASQRNSAPDTTPDHTSRVALQLALVTGLARRRRYRRGAGCRHLQPARCRSGRQALTEARRLGPAARICRARPISGLLCARRPTKDRGLRRLRPTTCRSETVTIHHPAAVDEAIGLRLVGPSTRCRRQYVCGLEERFAPGNREQQCRNAGNKPRGT